MKNLKSSAKRLFQHNHPPPKLALFTFSPNSYFKNIFNIRDSTYVKGKRRVDEVLDMFVRPFMCVCDPPGGEAIKSV